MVLQKSLLLVCAGAVAEAPVTPTSVFIIAIAEILLGAFVPPRSGEASHAKDLAFKGQPKLDGTQGAPASGGSGASGRPSVV